MPTGSLSSIGATALQLSGRSVRNRGGIRVKARASNSTNLVYVGGPSVTAGTADGTDGYELAAGDEILLPVNQFRTVSDVYVIGSTTGLKVSWWCDGEEALAGFDLSDPMNAANLLLL